MTLQANLERGIQLWKDGDWAEAVKVFKACLLADAKNESAWIWYIYTLENTADKISALESFLRIFPGHTTGLQALDRLKSEAQAASVPIPSQPVPSLAPPAPVESTPAARPPARPRRNVKRSVRQPAPLISPASWFLTFSLACLLLTGAALLNAEYRNMQVEMQALESRNRSLQTDRDVLNNNYIQLSEAFQSLNTRNSVLNQKYRDLAGKRTSVDDEYSLLSQKFNSLSEDYNNLNEIALKPPYIFVHDRLVDVVLYGVNGELISWTTPFSELESDIENGSDMRRLIVDENQQTREVLRADGTLLYVRDFSPFITTETFETVVPELYRRSPAPYDFIHQAWYMIGQLSNYTNEEIETPRYPLETLLAGGGDCEDLAILLASMLKTAPVDWTIDLLYVDIKNLRDPQEINHVLVYVDTGAQTFIIETTTDLEMLPYTQGVSGWLASSLNETDPRLPVTLR